MTFYKIQIKINEMNNGIIPSLELSYTQPLAIYQLKEMIVALKNKYPTIDISAPPRKDERIIIKIGDKGTIILPLKPALGSIGHYKDKAYADRVIFTDFIKGYSFANIQIQSLLLKKDIEPYISKIQNDEWIPKNYRVKLSEGFQFFDNTNPLSEISCLRKVNRALSKKKYKTNETVPDMNAVTEEEIKQAEVKKKYKTIGVISDSLRFLRPHFFNRLCILETPESDNIGIVRYLAAGASIDEKKNIIAPYFSSLKNNDIQYIKIKKEIGKWIACSDQRKENHIQARCIHIKRERGRKKIKYSFRTWYEIKEKLPSEIDYWAVLPGQFLGFSCLMVPFIQHNDGVRAMMGGKNLKQALPLIEQEAPLVKTGFEKVVGKLSHRIYFAEDKEEVKSTKIPSNQDLPLYQIPRVKKGETVEKDFPIVDAPGIKDGELCIGNNVLVAYLPFKGYNFEDAIVVSKTLVEKFKTEHLIEYTMEIDKNEEFSPFTGRVGEVQSLTPEGVIQKGIIVKRKEVLIRKLIYQDESKRKVIDIKVKEVKYDKEYPGEVVESIVENKWGKKVAKVWISATRPLEVGDKLTGRHGNKGVVSLILPQKRMPYFKLNGKKYYIEMLLNPIGVVSRMNLGQLFETHWGWVIKNIKGDYANIGSPFKKQDLEQLKELLFKTGLKEGKIELFTGEKRKKVSLGHTVVGYQYISKLNHLARDKFSVREKGSPYTKLLYQVPKGKKLGGGQRFGEMEGWALQTHNTLKILQEILTIKGDDKRAKKHIKFGKNLIPFSNPQAIEVARIFFHALGYMFDKNIPSIRKLKDTDIREKWNLISEKKDLIDENIFDSSNTMGYIKIKKERLDKETLKKLFFLIDAEKHFYLPVLPLFYRPDIQGKSNLTEQYEWILVYKGDPKKEMSSEERREKLKQWKEALNNRLEKLQETLVKMLKGKKGLLRQYLLGKRQDFSARAVIIPDPTLRINECGLPWKIMLEFLKDAFIESFSEEKKPEIYIVVNEALNSFDTIDSKLLGKLQEFVDNHKILVLLNRQPTLHKYNILAFRPKLRKDYVIAISPLICKGFNADFDGDQMAVHLPLSPSAQEEAEKLLPTKNLRMTNNELNLHTTKDIKLGLGLQNKDVDCRISDILEKEDKQIEEELLNLQLEAFESTTKGEVSFSIFDLTKLTNSNDIQELRNAFSEGNNQENIEKDFIKKKLFKNRFKAHKDNPFAKIVLSGATGNEAQIKQMLVAKGYQKDENGYLINYFIKNSYLTGLTELEYIISAHNALRTLKDKKLMTGKAGDLTRTLVEGAYEMEITKDNCHTDYCLTIRKEIIGEKYPEVLLGRVLAEEVQGIKLNTVIDEKVLRKLGKKPEVKIRSPLTCKMEKGICQQCYGSDLSRGVGIFPEEKYPVGILAGETIGERGTQLSMRTFHTGEEALDIELVKRIFEDGKMPKFNEKGETQVDSRKKVVTEKIIYSNSQDLFDLIISSMMKTYNGDIFPVHFEVILRTMIKDGVFKSMTQRAKDWRERGFISSLTFEDPIGVLREIFLEKDKCEDTKINRKVRLIFGELFAEEENEE